jgi:hypothetical protein
LLNLPALWHRAFRIFPGGPAGRNRLQRWPFELPDAAAQPKALVFVYF